MSAKDYVYAVNEKTGTTYRRRIHPAFISLNRIAEQHHLTSTVPAFIRRQDPAKEWGTIRLRREVLDVIDALKDRFAGNNDGQRLTQSEVFAVALQAALPVLSNGRDWR